jgi:hypothetical protein
MLVVLMIALKWTDLVSVYLYVAWAINGMVIADYI